MFTSDMVFGFIFTFPINSIKNINGMLYEKNGYGLVFTREILSMERGLYSPFGIWSFFFPKSSVINSLQQHTIYDYWDKCRAGDFFPL